MDEHDGAAAIRIKNRYAALYAARLRPGQSVELPEAPYLHLFVPRGAVVPDDAGPLGTGDAVRFTATAASVSGRPNLPRSSSGECTPRSADPSSTVALSPSEPGLWTGSLAGRLRRTVASPTVGL